MLKKGIKVVILVITIVILVIQTYTNITFSSRNTIKHVSKYKTEIGFVDLSSPFVELKELTINEGESYNILDFISSIKSDLIDKDTITYKDEKMSNYTKVGEYEITIICKDILGKEIEKTTKLIINEKKIISSPKTNEKTVTTKDVKKVSKTTTSKKVNTKLSTKDKILADNKKIGSAGRVYFSSLYSVALYYADIYEGGNAQKIVDNYDSAAYFEYGNTTVIGDHSSQGFDIIKKQNVGSYVYIKVKENNKIVLKRYVVVEKTLGKNKKTGLFTNDGRDLYSDVNVPLAMYTCNENSTNVTIILLKEA